MSVIDTKIERSNKKIDTLKKKLERVNIALNGGKNPYYYEERDLRIVTKELLEEQTKLDSYIAKKAEDERMSNIEAIETFLEQWKQKVIEAYKTEYRNLIIYEEDRIEKRKVFKDWVYQQYMNSNITREDIKNKEQEWDSLVEEDKKVMRTYSQLTIKLLGYGLDWKNKLEEWIEQDKVSKRRLLIARVYEVAGEILDAKGLHIGANGEINGFVVGTKGKASVETISAGGYNIQCYHYRVLVKELLK
jgi:hypothetical protein